MERTAMICKFNHTDNTFIIKNTFYGNSDILGIDLQIS